MEFWKEWLIHLIHIQCLKAEMPAVIDKVKQERDKERLKELSQRHKENPEAHRQVAKKHYAKNREEILAKRREAYMMSAIAASDRSE
jgi:hypothetical protein